MYLNLTDDPVRGVPLVRVRRSSEPTVDYEEGGPVLGASNLQGYTWVCEYQNPNIVIYREDTPEDVTTLLTVPNVSRLAFAFDQQMRPSVLWIASGIVSLYWYDPVVPGQVTTELGPATSFVTPCMSLDDHRADFVSESDIHIVYISGGNLCARTQRDRYEVENVLLEDAASGLVYFAFTDKYRMQWSAH